MNTVVTLSSITIVAMILLFPHHHIILQTLTLLRDSYQTVLLDIIEVQTETVS
jgi:hypothetical protein